MQKNDFMLNTTEIAEMMEMTHWDLLRKLEGRTQKNGKRIKGYIEILTEHQMAPSEFFIPSIYKDSSGKENKCYKVTKKGCEFLANKFTGEKGVMFTARYINRFHEMENMLSETAKPKISTEQMEKFLNFMEKQQQFMEDQDKFNQMVIKKLESPKRIQTHQDESPEYMTEYMTAAYKKQIIVLLDMADNGDLLFLKQIYTIIKAHARRLEKIGRYTNVLPVS